MHQPQHQPPHQPQSQPQSQPQLHQGAVTPPDSSRPSRAGDRPAGKLVAIALVAMGLAAAYGTYAYWKANWRHYREVRVGPGGASSPTTGTTDPQAVEREAQELVILGHRVLEEYRQKDGPPPPPELVRDVGAFLERHPDHAECRELYATLLIAVNRLEEGYGHLVGLLKAQTQRGDLHLLAVSKVGNFAVDLPDANVAVQVSGTFGSRQEEAQRLGRILRPKSDRRPAVFYSLVTRDSREEHFANNRQLFLTEQGYTYEITDAADL